MKRGYVDSEGLAKRLASLPSLSSDALKDEWRRLYSSPLPKKVRRTFLIAAIAYRIQEQALGGLKAETRRLLDKVADEARAGRKVEEGQFKPPWNRLGAGVARRHASGGNAGAGCPVSGPSLAIPIRSGAADHWRPLVRPGLLRYEETEQQMMRRCAAYTRKS